MTEHLFHFTNKVKQQFKYMLFFCMFFSVMGYFAPRIYLQYFDKTRYYKVSSPAKVLQKTYKPCEVVPVYIKRTVLTDLHAESTINLVLKSDDGKVKYGQGKRDLIITKTKGEELITTFWPIRDESGKCNVPDGIFYFDAVVEYPIQGIIKQEFFTTETFIVKK